MSRARWTVQYHQRILATDPIAYWILDEKQGTIAYDRVTGRALGAQNGAHTGVTLYQPGIGDGRASPLYDGANDYTDAFSAALAAAFDGDEGTLAIWARVSGAGVWVDGSTRRAFWFAVNLNNRVAIAKLNVNNQLQWNYRAGGVDEALILGGLATTDWMHLAITWDVNAGATGEMIAYYNGAQTGATQVALGAWVGALAAGSTQIGSFDQVPIQVWDGYLAHCAVWDRALTPAEIASLAVVE